MYCIAYWYCLLAPVIPVWNNKVVPIAYSSYVHSLPALFFGSWPGPLALDHHDHDHDHDDDDHDQDDDDYVVTT